MLQTQKGALPPRWTGMIHSSLAKLSFGQRLLLPMMAAYRYSAFASAIRRGDVSAQASGAKVLDNLASIAVQDQLLLRNSADLR